MVAPCITSDDRLRLANSAACADVSCPLVEVVAVVALPLVKLPVNGAAELNEPNNVGFCFGYAGKSSLATVASALARISARVYFVYQALSSESATTRP